MRILSDDDDHILEDGFVIQIASAKGFGEGMSKAQRLAVSGAVKAGIEKTKSRPAKRVDAHAPISDPFSAHVIGTTTVGQAVGDLAKKGGIDLGVKESRPKTIECMCCGVSFGVKRGPLPRLCAQCPRCHGCRRRVGKGALSPAVVARRHGAPPTCRACASRKLNASRTPEQKSEAIWKRNASMTPERRSEAARKGKASMTPEQRSEAARKAIATRKREAAKRDGAKASS